MGKGTTLANPEIRFCTNCGARLTLSAAKLGTRCLNVKECNRRAREKRPATPAPKLQTRAETAQALSKIGVTHEQILDALYEHFGYDGRKRREFLGEGLDHEYRHARYVAMFLFIRDLGVSQETAAGYIGRNRKTTQIAVENVNNNYNLYEHDINMIRKKYHAEAGQAHA